MAMAMAMVMMTGMRVPRLGELGSVVEVVKEKMIVVWAAD
jgi:hypothetical protein